MSAPIDYRISEEAGHRFAVVPLEQFTDLVERAGEVDALTLPHEIVSRHLTDEVPLVRCWREYLGMTQAELAARLDVSQAQVAQWERHDANLRHATLKRLAAAMGIHVSQLALDDD
jgi:DNA-binding transcriptional regulator YiaG